jgi:hypothetical protein
MPAIGRIPAPASTSSSAGYGPGRVVAALPTGGADAGPALRAAVAQAAGIAGGYVFVPAATAAYSIQTPVFIDQGVLLDCEPGTAFAGPTQSAAPLLYVGVGTDAVGTPYRPDLFGKLDAQTVGAAGQKFGLRTNGTGYFQSQFSPFSHGPISPLDGLPTGWYGQGQFTIEFAVEGFASGQLPAGLSLWGLGNTSAPLPFALQTYATNGFQFAWGTQTQKFGPVTQGSVTFSSGAATGVQRIAIQLDLVAGAIQVYANGQQVATSGNPPAAGSTLAENICNAFLVNGQGKGGQAAGGDFALYGLSIVPHLRYAATGAGTAQVAHPQLVGSIAAGSGTTYLILPGNPTGGTYTVTIGGATSAPIACTGTADNSAAIQAALQAMSTVGAGNLAVAGWSNLATGQVYRITGAAGYSLTTSPGMCDGAAMTGQTLLDTYRYFPANNTWPYQVDIAQIAYLPLTDPVGSIPLAWQGGSASNGDVGAGIFRTTGTAHAGGVTIRNASFGQTSASYGSPVVLGDVGDFRAESCSFGGGAVGLCWNIQGANYPITLRDCGFTGPVAGLFAYEATITASGLSLGDVSRFGLLASGCNLDVDGLDVPALSGNPYALVATYADAYGGLYRFRNSNVDDEGAAAYQLAAFYFEPTSYATTFVRVDEFYGGTLGRVPLFKLRSLGGPSTYPSAVLHATNLQSSTPGPIVDSDGPLWTGTIEGAPWGAGTYVAGDLSAGGRPAVRVVDDRSRTIPRQGLDPWRAGTVEVRAPWVDGLYERFRLAGDGLHGSATPPQWRGLDVAQASPSSLGAYGLDHTAISATLSGSVSSQGFLTNIAGAKLSAALFNGAALGAPTTWYAALLTAPVTADGNYAQEVSTSGTAYARVAAANSSATFAAASAGSKATAAAIAWPAATAAYTVQAVALYAGPSGGTPWAVVNFPAPIAVAPGQAPTIAAGGLAFAHVPYAGHFSGGLTDYGWGKCLDAAFGGAALGAPASWYPALSTAATSKATTSPAEPSGNGYARPALAAGSSWLVGDDFQGDGSDNYSAAGEARWSAPVGFGTPTGAWGAAVAATLQDAASGGNAWFQAPLVAPASPTSGWAAPAFAAGALVLAPR